MLHVLLLAQLIGFPEARCQKWVDSLAPDALCQAFQDGLIAERPLPGGGLPPLAAAETSRTRLKTNPAESAPGSPSSTGPETEP